MIDMLKLKNDLILRISHTLHTYIIQSFDPLSTVGLEKAQLDGLTLFTHLLILQGCIIRSFDPSDFQSQRFRTVYSD